MKINLTLVKPDFYDKFTCIGPACRHNCCSYNWRIAVDKQTYKKYKAYKGDPLLEKLFNENIKRNELGEDHNYGLLIHSLDENGNAKCLFQDEQGWCEIHKEMGAEALCNTCLVYPRVTNQFFPKDYKKDWTVFIHQSFYLGCEAVVEQLLDTTTPIELITEKRQPLSNEFKKQFPLITDTLSAEKRSLFDNYYYLLSIAIAILQNRELCFEDRLVLLGLYCQKLTEIEQNNTQSAVVEQIEEFIAGIDEKSFAETFNDIPPQINLKKQVKFLAVSSFIPALQVQENFFGDSFERIRRNFAGDELVINKVNIKDSDYICFKGNYTEFMADKQHFLENIFVTMVLSKNLPFNSQYTPFEGFQQLSALYMTLRFYIMYYLGAEKAMTKTQLIDLISSWGRLDGNAPSRTKQSVEHVINDGFEGAASLAQMVLYIK